MPRKSNLSIESITRGHITYLRLYGTVDETFDPGALLDAVRGRDVILNLKAVKRLSSFGVRDWVHSIEALCHNVNRVLLVECSPAIVAQLNMVSNFAAGATVVSVQMPYFCEACGWDTEATLTIDEARTRAEGVLPQVCCKRCRAPMRFDDHSESYFSFCQGMTAHPLEPGLTEFIRDFASAMAGSDVAQSGNAPESARVGVQGIAGRSLAQVAARARMFVPWSKRVGSAAAHAARVLRQAIARRPRLAIGIGGAVAAVAIVVTVVVLVSRPRDVSPEQLVQVHALLQSGRIDEAVAWVDGMKKEGRLSPELETYLAGQIDSSRQKVADAAREQVLTAFAADNFEQVVTAAERAAELRPLDRELKFLVGESLRQLGRCADAESHYAAFVEEASRTAPDDPHLDDAIFWQADCLQQAGRLDEARGLFRRVAYELPKSNFRNSALTRLRILQKGKERRRAR